MIEVTPPRPTLRFIPQRSCVRSISRGVRAKRLKTVIVQAVHAVYAAKRSCSQNVSDTSSSPRAPSFSLRSFSQFAPLL